MSKFGPLKQLENVGYGPTPKGVARTGPSPAQATTVAMENFSEVLLAHVRKAIDLAGIYKKTGLLYDGMTVKVIPNGHSLFAPPGRLDNVKTRRGFIHMLERFARWR